MTPISTSTPALMMGVASLFLAACTSMPAPETAPAAVVVASSPPAPAAPVAPPAPTPAASPVAPDEPKPVPPALPPDFWQAPAIKDYGKIHPLPDAAYRPTRTGIYKIVFAAEAGSKDPSEPISALDHAARAVNVYASAGVPKKHMKFVVVMAGPASMAAIDNEHYKAHFKVDNPNVPLIHALRDAGVEIVLCGQAASGAFAAGNIKFEWINPEVTLALSALTAIPILEQQGYALMNY